MTASLLILVTLAIVSPFVFYAIYARRETWVRWGSVATMLIAIPVALEAYLACLGSPMPVDVAKILPGKFPSHAQVLGAKIIVGSEIYVLLDDGENPPVFLSMPFTKELADQLQQALDSQAGAEFDGDAMNEGKAGGFPSWNTKPQFLPVPPPPPLPPKFLSPTPPVNLDSKHT